MEKRTKQSHYFQSKFLFDSTWPGEQRGRVLISYIFGFLQGIYKESQTRNAGTIYVPPVFWSLRESHRIDTLKRFELTDNKKNYREIETLYTPESWRKYIEVKRCCFRTQIVPKRDSDILAVTIKRKPHEDWKVIYFNR